MYNLIGSSFGYPSLPQANLAIERSSILYMN